MTTKMKGLLKGLRYISQIFEPNGKEQEMQIGYPTDVKHVAHIGWDGPSVNPPTWMNEFRSAPLSCIGAEAMAEQTPPRFPSQEMRLPRGIADSPVRDRDLSELLPPPPKPSRRHASGPSAIDALPRDSPSEGRQSRRNKSSGGDSTESPSREPSDGSIRPARRHHHRHSNSGKTGDESPLQDIPAIPKQSRRRKSKDSSGGGASRSKALTSSFLDPGSIDGTNTEQKPSVDVQGGGGTDLI